MNDTQTDLQGDLLVILRHGPHGSSLLREGLDMALVAAAFGRRVSLLFMGTGCTALVSGQGQGPLGQKGTQATLNMLEMYDIETLLVESEAMHALGLKACDLSLPVIEVSPAQIQAAMTTHRLVATF
uniref:DsrE family protein n=1 Tax=Halomonas sp. TaxID=1486246 RepID=UPI002613F1D1|nr:DsrE family protein [Halomonas sp.]